MWLKITTWEWRKNVENWVIVFEKKLTKLEMKDKEGQWKICNNCEQECTCLSIQISCHTLRTHWLTAKMHKNNNYTQVLTYMFCDHGHEQNSHPSSQPLLSTTTLNSLNSSPWWCWPYIIWLSFYLRFLFGYTTPYSIVFKLSICF